MTMMNNPLTMMMNVIQNGGNPMTLMNELGHSNPQIARLVNIMNGKSQEELRSLCETMCKERGTTPQDILKSLKIR